MLQEFFSCFMESLFKKKNFLSSGYPLFIAFHINVAGIEI